MVYLAITQGTAEWMQAKAGIIDGFAEVLLTGAAHFRDLEKSEFAEGPIRIGASKKREVIALWNTDYLAGTGEESWGFILVDSDRGLLGAPEIIREVLERCIYVISQRLQKLLIDGAYIHRSHGDGGHTLLAGRGRRARRYSIGYFEGTIDTTGSPRTCVLCVGPLNDPRFTRLSAFAVREAARLSHLLTLADGVAFARRSRPVAAPGVLQELRTRVVPYTRTQAETEYAPIEVTTTTTSLHTESYKVQGLSYRDWIAAQSPLTDVQRRILKSGVLDRHPLRIVGPGGSGKTLLMQLLAIRVIESARQEGRPCRILYVVHNSAMREKVQHRFRVLMQGDHPDTGDRVIEVMTLSDYGRTQLDLDINAVIDADAAEAKEFQLEQVTESLRVCLTARTDLVKSSGLLSDVKVNPALQDIFASLLMVEISIAIKGHGFSTDDRKRYVESQESLSRLHGVLNKEERDFVYEVFTQYHHRVFETFQVLDTDDVALSLLGRLRTPLWQLKRAVLGYNYIFVDETQLFNENERRVFSFLTNGATDHVPIALALDEAQQLYGQTTAGLATLGIKNIANESLPSIHRSTRAIVRLAFFVIQRCTELFNADFPDFTGIAKEMAPDSHPLARSPSYENAPNHGSVANLVLQNVQQLRRDNLRQIAVICHADQYWESLREVLGSSGLPLYILEQRGETLPSEQPITVLTRPAQIGGQEFDAVVLAGLEQGVVPARTAGNDALAAAVEEQALREIYLSVTRARYVVLVALSHRAVLTPVLRDAARANLLCRSNHHSVNRS